MQTVIGLVAAGVGISLVPESVRALVRPGVTYRPLDGDAPAVRLEMAWRAADESPVLRRSWRRRVRRPPPKEREVDGGQRAIDVATTPGRRDMYRAAARWGATKSSRENVRPAG